MMDKEVKQLLKQYDVFEEIDGGKVSGFWILNIVDGKLDNEEWEI